MSAGPRTQWPSSPGTFREGRAAQTCGSPPPNPDPMPLSDAVQELALLIRSRHPLVVIESPEASRVRSLLRLAADRVEQDLLTWSPTRGLRRLDAERGVYGTDALVQTLQHIAAAPGSAIYHMPAVVERLQGSHDIQALFREAVGAAKARGSTIFLTGVRVELPAELEPLGSHFSLPAPSRKELHALTSRILKDVSKRQDVDVSLTRSEFDRLLGQLQGLTTIEAEKILTKAMVEDGRLCADDIRHVVEAKKNVIEREGLLEYYPVNEHPPEIAGMTSLRKWLSQRAAFVLQPERAQEFGLSFPRGVLLLGVPGCGKSLSAKAVAAEWTLPLLKLDPSNLYNKYIGESERNFKRAMQAAERMAPVVLWVDELEKAFASGDGSDGGVSTRILGSFLSWMQERAGDVFVVATANQIDKLPPELLRKGRFDEIFFVDLPDAATRAEIFRIHLSDRKQAPENFDLEALASATDGFSGAEIEQVVVSALFSAFSGSGGLSQEAVLEEAAATVPLARTMAERVDAMRAWARERAVPAN